MATDFARDRLRNATLATARGLTHVLDACGHFNPGVHAFFGPSIENRTPSWFPWEAVEDRLAKCQCSSSWFGRAHKCHFARTAKATATPRRVSRFPGTYSMSVFLLSFLTRLIKCRVS